MEIKIKDIRAKKLKEQSREELTYNRKYTLHLINNTTNHRTRVQETKYLTKIDNEIRKRNNNAEKE